MSAKGWGKPRLWKICRRAVWVIGLAASMTGCARLFGWDIHAPGILSQNYYQRMPVSEERVALFMTPGLINCVSTDKGTRWSDPQTYHVGEAAVPIMIEGFQHSFGEFVSLETEPEPDILRQYGIPYLVVVDFRDFWNLKKFKSQALVLETEVGIYDSNMKLLARFLARGTSDAQQVFAKKGGPEVNMNAAIENNVLVTTEFVLDFITARKAANR